MKTAYDARIVYTKEKVTVSFDTESGKDVAEFKPRKSWSHRKYVDKGMEQLSLEPGPFMSYGWDMTAI